MVVPSITDPAEWFSRATAHRHIDRDLAVRSLSSANRETALSCANLCLGALAKRDETTAWELLLGCVWSLRVVVDKHCAAGDPLAPVTREAGRDGTVDDAIAGKADADKTQTNAARGEPSLLPLESLERLLGDVKSLLDHPEPRVRTQCADTLRSLCTCDGLDVWATVSDKVMAGIRDNMVRDANDEMAADQGPGDYDDNPRGFSGRASPAIGSRIPGPPGPHDTQGWKTLETSMKALQRVAEGLGPRFLPHLDTDLLDTIVEGALGHKNRFVRETGFFTLGALCEVGAGHENLALDMRFAEALARGLEDNWSQVRYAAAVAARRFLLAHGNRTQSGGEDGEANDCTGAPASVLSLLLPRMCLNRYYVAEGVRLHAATSWREVCGMQGRRLVAEHVAEFVRYYVRAAEADNHAVREAACQVMAELADKVDRSAVLPHVQALVGALHASFLDESWPVRDHACTATGRFVAAFPDECRSWIDDAETPDEADTDGHVHVRKGLYSLWVDHLGDNVWSVRENAAVALGRVCDAYGDWMFDRCTATLDTILPKVFDQQQRSGKAQGLSNTTQFGVAKALAPEDAAEAKRLRDNDPLTHTDQVMFSCGSLAPKMKRRGGGCMDHGFVRPREPWEWTDGAVYLARELSGRKGGKGKGTGDQSGGESNKSFNNFNSSKSVMTRGRWETILGAAEKRDFDHADDLATTILTNLPALVRASGEQVLAGDEELSARLAAWLFTSAMGVHRLSASAAGMAIRFIRGSGIAGGMLVDRHWSQEQIQQLAGNRFVAEA